MNEQRLRAAWPLSLSAVAVRAAPFAAGMLILLLLTKGGLRYSELALVALVAATAVGLAALHPVAALTVLIVYVPLQLALLSWLLRIGVPMSFVRYLGFVKEAVVAGLVLAAVHKLADSPTRRRWDGVDWLAAAYLLLATVYLLLPFADRSILGGLSFSARLNAWRLDCLFVVAFLACRRLRLDARSLERLRVAMLAVAVVLAAFAGWEFAGTQAFNHFMVDTIQLPRYKALVLRVPFGDPNSVITYGLLAGHRFVRAGSLLNDYLSLGFLMLVTIGIGLVKLSGSALPWRYAGGTFAAAVCTLLTLTRAPLLGAGVALLLSFFLGAQRRAPGRTRVALLVMVGALALAPIASTTSLQQRLLSISNTQEADNQGHINRSSKALDDIVTHPLGFGLGANPVTGARFRTSTSVTAENYYLQVGNELGVPAMAAFIALVLSVLYRLRRTALSAGELGALAGGLWLAGWGISVGALFLHVWNSFPVALTFWPLAGLALPTRSGRGAELLPVGGGTALDAVTPRARTAHRDR